jgi:glutaredoxin
MITVYSKDLCPHCDGAEHYLKQNNFEYKKVNIAEDKDAYEFVKSQGHKTVPQIYYNDYLLVEGGYDGLRKLMPFEIEKRIKDHAKQ